MNGYVEMLTAGEQVISDEKLFNCVLDGLDLKYDAMVLSLLSHEAPMAINDESRLFS